MKVLMLNGSPRKEGCTYTALIQIAGVLEKNGIESEIFQAGTPELENVRAAAEKMKEADALIVGSPVYWASPSGQIIIFMVSGVQLLCTGIVGQYLSKTYLETKHRPIFILKDSSEEETRTHYEYEH